MADYSEYYDVGIVGGGLGGLALAIQLARDGVKTILLEKESYPFHKVCGEYISLETKELLVSLGCPLEDMHLPIINTLQISSPGGSILQQQLPLGGLGVSRYTIDNILVDLARKAGATIMENTKVISIEADNEGAIISTDNLSIQCTVCCAAFGKRSNVDVKWKRRFVQEKPNALNNYIGVKYHAVADHPRQLIGLHIFKDGYCGISPIEDGKTCICYLTTAANLRNSGNNIKQMEQSVLFKNNMIKDAFAQADFLYDAPLTISQISFSKKEQVYKHLLMVGDAAGMITPLCGNGMSMALLASVIAAGAIRISYAETKAGSRWKLITAIAGLQSFRDD